VGQRGRLRRVHRAVYLYGGGEPTQDARLYAAAMAIGDDAVLGHIAAAAIDGYWPYAVPSVVDVIVPRHVGPRRGIRVHGVGELPPDAIKIVRGVSITTPAWTIIGPAGTTRKDYVFRRVVHEAQAQKKLAFADLATEFERAPQTIKGRARILTELRAGPTPTRSGFEDWTVELLRAGDFPQFVTTAHPPGTPPWVEVDIMFEDHGLVIEVDGGRWHDTPWRRERDERKRAVVRDAEYELLVLTDEDGEEANRSRTAERIRTALHGVHTLAPR
jgi:hypothetical protein